MNFISLGKYINCNLILFTFSFFTELSFSGGPLVGDGAAKRSELLKCKLNLFQFTIFKLYSLFHIRAYVFSLKMEPSSLLMSERLTSGLCFLKIAAKPPSQKSPPAIQTFLHAFLFALRCSAPSASLRAAITGKSK